MLVGKRDTADKLTLPVALLIAAALASCGSSSPGAKAPAVTPHRGSVTSNVRFVDYAGTQTCARCHAEHVESWLRSPMHNMTREARTAEVKGPFDGTVFRFHDDTARLERAGADRFVTVTSKRFGDGIYKVTRVIGGHHREDYAGVAVAAVRDGAPALGDPSEEHVLPVSFVLPSASRPGSLRYKGYSVMVQERDGLKVGPVWNQTCIFCHNTVPYLSTVLGALAGSGVYQGEVLDPLLPASMRATYVVTDERAMHSALEQELARLGAPDQKPALRDAIATTRSRFRASHLVEVGIGCESCHLGSAEHAKDPTRLPSFEPVSDAFAVRLPAKSAEADRRAAALNRACARCHQVLFSGYEPTWEGGSRKRSPGGSHINSGEARDMMLGACASKLTCVDCHDPHAHDGTAALRKLDPAKEDALCTRCHSGFSAPDALRAHSHHDPAGAGARCLSCHMPRKNMSLDGGLSRYHRIGSPADMQKVLLDRPVECALCHVDKDVRFLVETMEKWWHKAYERGALEKLYGSLDANVILATAERGKPHEQAVAFQLLGDARMKAAVPVLASQLTNPYPLVRGYAKRAVESIRGEPVLVDIDGPREMIEEQARRLR
ncbi:MAG TPA: cytochrome c3 family protein [Labilithrix sp.]|nr:cytochrome c3 family protein [Labilithrix sp.]